MRITQIVIEKSVLRSDAGVADDEGEEVVVMGVHGAK
jgi:hypothetical protein